VAYQLTPASTTRGRAGHHRRLGRTRPSPHCSARSPTR